MHPSTMAGPGRACTPYHRQLSSGPTVIVRNGFLDLAPAQPDVEETQVRGGALGVTRRSLSAPPALCTSALCTSALSTPASVCARKCLAQDSDCASDSDTDSDTDSDSTCSIVMSLTMDDTRPSGTPPVVVRGEARELAGSAPAWGHKLSTTVSSRLQEALGLSSAWSEEDGQTTSSDAEASSLPASSMSPQSMSRQSMSPLLSAAASPPGSFQASPVLVAALPPLVLPPSMLLPPWAAPAASAAPAPWAPSWQSRPQRSQPGSPPGSTPQRPQRASRKQAPKGSAQSSPASSPQLRPKDVPEFAPALIAADPCIGSHFLSAVPPTAHTISHAVSAATGVHRVVWTVDAEKLRSQERQAVSPSFELPMGESVVSRLVIFPKPAAGARGGASFKKSKGWGSVQLKCEASSGFAIFQVSIGDGSGNFPKQPRGPVRHNFADHSTCGLPKDLEQWDFGKAVSKATQTFAVCLDILPRSEA